MHADLIITHVSRIQHVHESFNVSFNAKRIGLLSNISGLDKSQPLFDLIPNPTELPSSSPQTNLDLVLQRVLEVPTAQTNIAPPPTDLAPPQTTPRANMLPPVPVTPIRSRSISRQLTQRSMPSQPFGRHRSPHPDISEHSDRSISYIEKRLVEYERYKVSVKEL